ncbi:MAG: MtaA/CmuA family methyltransferase [Methanosarcinaceae archaeon]|jgi:[methyl-Co(III) methanol-specific corrinoid protein]:coenzyme M methyltransferase|nr:MtaA/CmuA family methyltransferase [Methanosarcinaceae archaeon]NKQ38121.1 MtaA/CmuA family methyltransferase [Methanosarcinales archaeon]
MFSKKSKKIKSISQRKRMTAAAVGGVPDRVPATVLFLGIKASMNAMDAHFPEAHYDADKMAKLGSALNELAGVEAAVIPFCLTVLSEIFGCKINFGTDEITPSIKEHLPSVDGLKVPDNLLECGRIPVVRDAIKIIRSDIGDQIPISVPIEGPFTLAGSLIGVEKLMGWCVSDPEKVKELTDIAAEAIIKYANYTLKAGADIICIADPTPSFDLISPAYFKEFAKPPLKKVTANISGVTVLHICGNNELILADMAECGFHGLSIDENIDIEKARKLVGEDIAIVGNVSPKQTLAFGTPDQVKEESMKALKAGVDILAPGCGLSPLTPLDNLKAMVQAAEEWNQPRRKMVTGGRVLTPETAKELGYGIGEALVKLLPDK